MPRRTLLFIACLAARAQTFQVSQLDLHQYEDGPVLAASYEFLPGETAWFSCKMSGFKTERSGSEQAVKVAWEMRVEDPAGVLLEKPLSGKIQEQLTPEDKNWQPKFLASFAIPPYAPGGTYRIPVQARDELAGTEARKTLEFRVRGASIEPADSLVLRSFRFLREEDATTPLEPAVFHPGTTLWARFDIAGYQLGENNRYSVDYGLAVLDATGKQLFAIPEAATESKQSFYPQRVVPGTLSLTLDNNVLAAAYTLVVTVHDRIGNTTTERREAFQVE